MAKKSDAGKDAEKKSGGFATGRKLLEAVKKHQDALQLGGLQTAVVEKFENALKGMESGGKQVSAAAQVLVKDIGSSVGSFQAAIRKEFPGNAAFHAFFKAHEPLPTTPVELLSTAREVAKQAPEFASNLIKHALNAASVKHLGFLADQLEKEIGGIDPRKLAADAEKHIHEIVERTFGGKPEISKFK